MEVPANWFYHKCGSCGVFIQDGSKMANHLRSHVKPNKKDSHDGKIPKSGSTAGEVYADRFCFRPVKVRVERVKLPNALRTAVDQEIIIKSEVDLDNGDSADESMSFSSEYSTDKMPSPEPPKGFPEKPKTPQEDDEDWAETFANYEEFEISEEPEVPRLELPEETEPEVPHFELPEEEEEPELPQCVIVSTESIQSVPIPTSKISFKCPYCQSDYQADRDLQTHVELAHGNVTAAKTCELYSIPAFTPPELTFQMKSNHKDKDDSNGTNISPKLPAKNKISLICRHCKQYFQSHFELQQHIKGHWMPKEKTSRPFSSFLKMKSFPKYLADKQPQPPMTSQNAKVHQEELNGQIQGWKKYTCLECGATLASGRTLRRHYEKHGTAVKCHLCGAGFKNRNGLISHHQRMHSQLLYCEDCAETFTSETALKEHSEGHGTRVKCGFCPTIGFIDESRLAAHVERMHGIQYKPKESSGVEFEEEYLTEGEMTFEEDEVCENKDPLEISTGPEFEGCC